MPSLLTINTGPDDATLLLSGQLDSITAPQLQARLDELGTGRSVALDLKGITYIDSAGLAVLMTGRTAHDAAGNYLSLDRPSNAVVAIFESTELTDHLRSD